MSYKTPNKIPSVSPILKLFVSNEGRIMNKKDSNYCSKLLLETDHDGQQ